MSIMTGSNIVLQLTVFISNFYKCVFVTKLQRRAETVGGWCMASARGPTLAEVMPAADILLSLVR